MGNKHTNRVNSVKGHSNMKLLPLFFVLKVQMYSIFPHGTTLGRVWIARIRVPPMDRIPRLVEINGLIVAHKLQVEDKAVRFVAIRG